MTRTFAADPEIIRQTITLNGQSVVVVGVGPEGFDGIELTKAAFFASTSLQPGFNEDPHLMRPIAFGEVSVIEAPHVISRSSECASSCQRLIQRLR